MIPFLSDVREISLKIKNNYRDKSWWRSQARRRINSPFQRRLRPPHSGVRIMDEDWDTLIVLDGCRFDLFEKNTDFSRFSEYSRKLSRASATGEWCQANFDSTYPDTVYITANPVPSRKISGTFHDVINVWEDGFDKEISTVSAATTTREALKAHREYPNKRIIVHYLQPHYPFVKDKHLHFKSWEAMPDWETNQDTEPNNVWYALAKGHVDKSEVLEAYRRNLEYVMDQLNPLLKEIGGRIVVTSDHGNAIGERSFPIPIRQWSHPPYLRLKCLITVPWAVISGKRRQIIDGQATATMSPDTEPDDLQEKLAALGYAEGEIDE